MSETISEPAADMSRPEKKAEKRETSQMKEAGSLKAVLPVSDVQDASAGHRGRMRDKLLEYGAANLSDAEILEMALYNVQKRSDVKPLVKMLLKQFKSIGGVIAATDEELRAFPGVGDALICQLRVINEAGLRLTRDNLKTDKPVMQNWKAVLRYVTDKLSHARLEHCLVLYLDSQNRLITDEILTTGTNNQAILYPSEIARSALRHHANAVILVHNHPSHDTRASDADIQITRKIKDALNAVDVELHDHLIVAGRHCKSFKSMGLL